MAAQPQPQPQPPPSNSAILEQLQDGTAQFQLLQPQPPFLSPSYTYRRCHPYHYLPDSPPPSWGRITSNEQSRALLRAHGQRRWPLHVSSTGQRNGKEQGGPTQFHHGAPRCRMAVKEVICDSTSERQNYEEALLAITIDEPLGRYCQRIRRPNFWGGESELLVLSKLLHQPIIVYIPEREYSLRGSGNGFIRIAECGLEFGKSSKQGRKRMPVRLLYSGRNHYDLLV